jgi:hypothetical protein
MRNDARPIGEDAPASPVGGDARPIPSERPDSRDTVAHGRESHVVNRPAEDREPDHSRDPVTPQSDASLNTKI